MDERVVFSQFQLSTMPKVFPNSSIIALLYWPIVATKIRIFWIWMGLKAFKNFKLSKLLNSNWDTLKEHDPNYTLRTRRKCQRSMVSENILLFLLKNIELPEKLQPMIFLRQEDFEWNDIFHEMFGFCLFYMMNLLLQHKYQIRKAQSRIPKRWQDPCFRDCRLWWEKMSQQQPSHPKSFWHTRALYYILGSAETETIILVANVRLVQVEGWLVKYPFFTSFDWKKYNTVVAF